MASIDRGEPKPIDHHVPDADGEAALEKKVCVRFIFSLAKLAKTTIWPTTTV